MAAVKRRQRLVEPRALSEEWPDGTFGGVRLVPGRPSEPIRCPRPDPQAAEHRAELVAELDLTRAPQRRDRA
ncbi:hypothetical protein [Streptomyces sp. NPDC048332]|uniref:hypothetical protein n=1 Tax=Streptomyces sp. NPDC048332 TaxID=3154619 RepID=UPI0034400B9C